MVQSARNRIGKFGLASWLAIGGAIITSLGNCANAQITPDKTLGNESSNVKSTGSVDQIEGGATRGANLFHSFEEFSVDQGRAAYFTNPAGIENILSRVTGSNPSEILGTLGVSGGNANLFFINPNGIVFGSNARLDVGGSFVGTTANGIELGNQGVFSASNPESSSSLLTVKPSALLFNQIRAASIENRSVAPSGFNPSSEFRAMGLRVPNGNSLLLVGGELNLNGGGLFAFGGRVELGGLAGAGMVRLNGEGNNLSLSYPNGVERSDVTLTNGAKVNVTAGDGGSIAVNARNLEMPKEGFLWAGIESGLGSDLSKAGNIEVNATRAINLNNASLIANQVRSGANGQGGDINITASTLQVESGSQVSAATFGEGKGGNLIVDASEVQVIGASKDGKFPSGLNTTAASNSTGDAGDLRINTSTLLVDGAQVNAATSGEGKGGNLIVDASEVQVIGTSKDGKRASGLFTGTEPKSTGDAGDLRINTNTLLARDGAQVRTGTFGQGKGGNLTVDASEVQLIGTSKNGQFPSGLLANAEPNSTGDSGDLRINTNTLLVRDEAEVTVSSTGSGNAGELRVEASSIRLEDQGKLTSETNAGQGGNIALQLQNLLLLREQSQISTTAGTAEAGGDVGNIDIDSDFIVAVPGESSDITADAFAGNGGNIDIDAFSVFGIEPREVKDSASNDITASSELGLEGTIEIDTPNVDPSRGLVNLPTVPVETEVAQACSPGSSAQQSEFVVTGRGGLPPTPEEALSNDAIQVDWVSLNPEAAQEQENREAKENSPTSSSSNSSVPNQIVEAQGWVTAPNGEVVLTASATPGQRPSSWLTPANCHDN